MFNKNMRNSLRLSNAEANQMFSNIRGDSFMGDPSFVATMRALLGRRIDPDQSVVFATKSIVGKKEDVERVSASEFFIDQVGLNNRTSEIIIYNIHGNADGVQSVLNKFDMLPNHDADYIAQPVLSAFFVSGVAARFYVNEKLKKTIIAVANMNLKMYHVIQALMPKYFPWYFAGDDCRLTPRELSLMRSLQQKESDEYEAIMEEIASEIDFRSFMIKQILGGFSQKVLDKSISSKEEYIARLRDEMNDLVIRYNDKLRNIHDESYYLLGLKASRNSGEMNDELVDYFTADKNLIPVASRENGFSFIVKTYLDIVDPDMYRTIADNEHSFLYNLVDDRWTRDDIRTLLDAIFSEEPTLRIKTCAYYYLSMDGIVQSQSDYNFPTECNDRLPNPHLQIHNCLGNHRPVIAELVERGDMTGAVMQCISSARSMNICESITSERFIEDMLNTDKRAIELPDGTSVTAREALEWLRNQKEENDGKAD